MIAVESVHLRTLAPRARTNERLFDEAGSILFDYGINFTPLRMSHFFAQVLHETSGLTTLTESLDYRAQRLVEIWPSRFRTLASARPYAHNPIALANKVYGGRMGNRQANDGWRYIGRGLLQCTGRAMYERISRALDADLVTHPELVNTPKWALPAACEVWKAANGNILADRDDILTLTRAINGGTIGLNSRRNWLAKTREVWPQEH